MRVRKEIEERIIDLLEIEAIRKKVVGTLPYGCKKGWSWPGPWP
jgi:branched-chain amino acid transport system ATP-binding protein